MCVFSQHICKYMLGAPGGQKRESDLLELEFKTVVNCGYWELNLDLLKEQPVLLAVEPSLRS